MANLEEAIIARIKKGNVNFEILVNCEKALEYRAGKITDLNPSLIALLDCKKEECTKKPIWEITFFKNIVSSKDQFNELQQKEYVSHENIAVEMRNGQKSTVDFTANTYQVDGQKVVQCFIRDISNYKLKQS